MPFLILDGESQDEFVDLLMDLTLKYYPCGPDQEDCVLTMAKCIARKKRSEKLLDQKLVAAKLNPNSKAYDEAAALRALLELLNKVENAEEVERALQCIDTSNSHYLRNNRPRHRYRSARAWISAMVAEIERVLLPRATRLGPPPDELRFLQAAAALNEDYLASELDFERQIDAIYDQAFSRLERLKAADRSVTYAERLRFYRAIRRPE